VVVRLALILVLPAESVVKLLALTVLLNRVVPLLLTLTFPNEVVFPTESLKLTFPVPLLMVTSLASPLWESTVLLKVMLLSVVLNMTGF
jgi:hypothetical protein